MIGSSCTTATITVDKSAYWIPDLYYEWPNKTYTLVPNGGLTVYVIFIIIYIFMIRKYYNM